MSRETLLAALLVAMLAVPAVQAAEKGEIQWSLYAGQQRLRVDAEHLYSGDTKRQDMGWMGVALGYRMPSGFLVEGAIAYSAHDGWFEAEDDVVLGHYSGAVGWQIGAKRWRFTPKIGVLRSKINIEGRSLLSENDNRTDRLYSTVPFLEASVTRRFGNVFSLGATFRDTFEDFGHSRSWGVICSFSF